MFKIKSCIYQTPPEGTYIVIYRSSVDAHAMLGVGRVNQTFLTKTLIWDEDLFPTKLHWPIATVTVTNAGVDELYRHLAISKKSYVEVNYSTSSAIGGLNHD